ncbi:uncharacterized protein LOC123430168 [Hordeum vulgare subsp. vulgare]|uniref:uncharacterized protein LOC123430168 n=1 Tax=Hordeum vulgare subsp. vulgare TaxID=112509 RepID=UPI001D1A399C|nr:uncharacterized protein LOC123430168 [Hordeum vulgare subsp. vulgare]
MEAAPSSPFLPATHLARWTPLLPLFEVIVLAVTSRTSESQPISVEKELMLASTSIWRSCATTACVRIRLSAASPRGGERWKPVSAKCIAGSLDRVALHGPVSLVVFVCWDLLCVPYGVRQHRSSYNAGRSKPTITCQKLSIWSLFCSRRQQQHYQSMVRPGLMS